MRRMSTGCWFLLRLDAGLAVTESRLIREQRSDIAIARISTSTATSRRLLILGQYLQYRMLVFRYMLQHTKDSLPFPTKSSGSSAGGTFTASACV